MEREHHFDGGYAVFDIDVSGDYRAQTLESPAEYPEVHINSEAWYDDDGNEIDPIRVEREYFLDEILDRLEEEQEEDYGDYLADCRDDYDDGGVWDDGGYY